MKLPKIFKKLLPFRRRWGGDSAEVLIVGPTWTKTQRKLVSVHMQASNLHLTKRLR